MAYYFTSFSSNGQFKFSLNFMLIQKQGCRLHSCSLQILIIYGFAVTVGMVNDYRLPSHIF
jgi:hypothetical protein